MSKIQLSRFAPRKLGCAGVLNVIAGVSCAALSIGAASAADLSRPPPTAPPYVPPYYNWTGFYIGVNGGGAWGTSNWSPLPGSFNTSGGLVGGTLGYNWQFGQWVWGLEGDADWSDIQGNTTGPGCGIGGICTTKNDFLATVRGRLGFAADRWMPYVTGGLAIGDIKSSNPIAFGVDQTNAGWTVGGGLEFALASNWTAKVEYLYVDLGNVNCTVTCSPLTNSVSFTANVVRGGFNWRF
jgi:outer membrane immunogenic protein